MKDVVKNHTFLQNLKYDNDHLAKQVFIKIKLIKKKCDKILMKADIIKI